MSQMLHGSYSYKKNVVAIHQKLEFNWVSCISSGNPSQTGTQVRKCHGYREKIEVTEETNEEMDKVHE